MDNIVLDIASKRPAICHGLWVSHEFYMRLLEMGMITFERDGEIALFMGMELRVVERLGSDYKFAAT